MKRTILIIIVILIFLAGIGVLAYPLVSSVINNMAVREGADTYRRAVEQIDKSEINAQFDEAEKYNESLHRVILTDPFDAKSYGLIGENYSNTFTMSSDGVIGYIDVPKINVYLPIYHGTSLDILARGAGHLEHSSLPIGGKSTHSVISAHSAFPGETFFDYLTDLEEGDEFYIHVLDRTLKYEVDKISVVLPDDTAGLQIVDGEDYVTLVTCTPYSVNTHRLLVRGTRVPYDPSEDAVQSAANIRFADGHLFFLGYKLPYLTVGLIIGGFVLFVAAVVTVIVMTRRSKKRKLIGRDRGSASDDADNTDADPDDKAGEPGGGDEE